MKILVLEDNKTLNETIKLKLELKGFEVDSFMDGKEAFEAITDGYNCFVLDINVPNLDGIKILEKIREFYEEIPVVIISATVELNLIKKAYELGCNDYLKKPFFIDELEIKIDRMLNLNKKAITFFKDCSFDFSKSLLTIENKQYFLTEKENFLMNLFLKNQNELVSYETIQNYVWQGEYTSLDAIRTLIRRLRKKLPKESFNIKAFTNRGYSFTLLS